MPGRAFQPGEQVSLTLHFADGRTPASATLWLRFDTATATRQVKVFRQPRPAADYQAEAEQLRVANLHLREQVRQLTAERGPGGLAGMILDGLLTKAGIASREVKYEKVQRPGEWLAAGNLTLHRGAGRVAVALEAWNFGSAEEVTPTRAVLRGPSGDLRNLHFSVNRAIPPGKAGHLLLEAAATEAQARGLYSLMVWDSQGNLLLTVPGISFP
jgi:uncharacterized protein (TIGR02268 family)